MEFLFAEGNGVKMAGAPASLAATAFTGARISLEAMDRVAVIVAFDDVAEDVTVSFQEHTASTGGTTATIVNGRDVFVKLDAETSFTKEAFAAADGSGVVGTVVYEFLAEDLSEGFTHLSANIASATLAKIVSVTYVSHKMDRKPAYSTAL